MENNMLTDTTGREIRAGDLVRTPHFRGARRKQYYLYFIIYELEGYLYAASPLLAAKALKGITNGFALSVISKEATILYGYACQGNETSFEDRPKE